jgi:hypothetical protein
MALGRSEDAGKLVKEAIASKPNLTASNQPRFSGSQLGKYAAVQAQL